MAANEANIVTFCPQNPVHEKRSPTPGSAVFDSLLFVKPAEHRAKD
jgi:hypothetical protein